MHEEIKQHFRTTNKNTINILPYIFEKYECKFPMFDTNGHILINQDYIIFRPTWSEETDNELYYVQWVHDYETGQFICGMDARFYGDDWFIVNSERDTYTSGRYFCRRKTEEKYTEYESPDTLYARHTHQNELQNLIKYLETIIDIDMIIHLEIDRLKDFLKLVVDKG